MDAAMTLFAQQGTVTHRLARLQALNEWWHWPVLAALCVAVIAYVVWMYRKDSVELRPGTAVLLTLLRICAFLGILFFFFDLEKRAERKVVKNSRVALLIDTSQSMGLRDQQDRSATGQSRIEQVANELADGSLIKTLREKHDVVAYRFDQGAKPIEIASFPKTAATKGPDAKEQAAADELAALRAARIAAAIAGALVVIALIAGVIAFLGRNRPRHADDTSWSLLVSMVFFIAAAIVMAVASLASPRLDLLATLGLRDLTAEAVDEKKPDDQSSPATEPAPIDWFATLSPRGVETRIGDSIDFLVNKERGGPIAGIVVFSDGGHNAGQPMNSAIVEAQNAGIPVYAVGLGSDKRPQNARVVDIEVPQRVYPGDKFQLTAFLDAFGLAGRTFKVELLETDKDGGGGTSLEVKDVKLPAKDGESVPVAFDITPEEVGKKYYMARILMDSADYEPKDNQRGASLQVIERKQKVLLVAGGPSREYQFIRNLLYRSKDTTVDVILQSGAPGISQEANELLFEFPDTEEELAEYDCIIGFDPDWEALTVEQVKMLDRWVADDAGGLVVLAGPVFTPQWSARRPGDERADTLRGLYPVAFYHQGSATLSLGRFGGDKPWPLRFSRDGLDAEFLWVADTGEENEQIWTSFEGVYGYYAVKDPKPGARVYARFSDPDTEIDGDLPIYLAGHYFGAGRVFFQASGEMWRVRQVSDTYFDVFYTKLIRWASQGRLMRDSKLGVLLVDKERCLLGDQIGVQAVLKDSQRKPLTEDEVNANVVQPDGNRVALKLRRLKNAAREGTYSGQFTAQYEGDFRVELYPPGSSGEEPLVREVRARVPSREVERPERNDPLLKELVTKTGGEYFIGMPAAMNRSGAGRSLVNVIDPQDQTTYIAGTPDKNFERVLMIWLLALISGVLCLEWLIRRLSKLA